LVLEIKNNPLVYLSSLVKLIKEENLMINLPFFS
jgi:hypothetical protein